MWLFLLKVSEPNTSVTEEELDSEEELIHEQNDETILSKYW
jgi:hypothetical protein